LHKPASRKAGSGQIVATFFRSVKLLAKIIKVNAQSANGSFEIDKVFEFHGQFSFSVRFDPHRTPALPAFQIDQAIDALDGRE
jgi:hypothetical protein